MREASILTAMKLGILFVLCFFSLSTFSEEGPKRILFLGDSLTAGYGVQEKAAYPALFQELVTKELKREVVILNGSVSGSTTASGMSRLRWYLRRTPDVVVIALGANDGLRGIAIEESKKNLDEMIRAAKEAQIQVVLAGMLMPSNYGEDYRTKFASMYEELVKKHNVVLIPFLLEGVATVKELNQADGIHPNEEGHKIMAQTVYKTLKELL